MARAAASPVAERMACHDPGVAGALEDGAHDIEGGVDHAPGDVAAQRREKQRAQRIAVECRRSALAPSVQVSTSDQPEQDLGQAPRPDRG